jgi:pimeloyl-ACP methyl ester carboxylesterase
MSAPSFTRRALTGASVAGVAACASTIPAPREAHGAFANVARASNAHRRLYAPSPWGEMHVALNGNANAAKPALFCLHMMPFSGAQFRPFQAEMAKDRLVLAPDFPGCGGSTRPAGPYAMADVADAMLSLADHLGIGAFDVLGYHTGAALGATMAVRAGPRVRRAVLSGIPLFGEAEITQRLAALASRDYVRQPEQIDSRWRQIAGWMAGASDERKVELFAESLRIGLDGVHQVRAVLAWPARETLAAMAQPTLVPVLNEGLAANTRAAAPLIPKAELREFAECGEDAWEARVDVLAAATRAFLNRS